LHKDLCVSCCRMAEGGRPQPDQEVCLLGHSYIRRVYEHYLQESKQDPTKLFTVDGRVVRVRASPQGGASAVDSNEQTSVFFLARLALLRSPTPVAFFVHIGECDVADRRSGLELLSPDVIAQHIKNLVNLLLSRGVRFVVVGQLVVWPRQQPFAQNITQVNFLLEEALASMPCDRVKFWRHRGGFSQGNTYDADGVHLNEHGLVRYWHSIRQALSFGISRAVAPTPTPVTKPP